MKHLHDRLNSLLVNGRLGREEEYASIETQIRAQHESFRSLYDMHRLGTFEASSMFDINMVLGCATLYGSGLVLHSLWADLYPESQAKMLECLRCLVDVCAQTKAYKHPHLGLMSVVHLMNAVRLIAHELKRSRSRENIELLASYFLAVDLLLDFLDDSMVFFPAWVDVLPTLKDTLTASAHSLSS
ncbi:hypothetical protein DL93DRAFT_2083223 [Clavulina sp. PMI_390]|nr:hypothetical protein DL93DRAFT_2083223 [Clavulina sp. PMI_390]